MALRSRRFPLTLGCTVCGSYNPIAHKEQWFGLGPRSLAATWGISVDFSFLEVLRCFSSLGSLSPKGVTVIADSRVSPFGHPGINACVPLPLAYRSLPRPSSPPCAQASPTYLLSKNVESHDHYYLPLSNSVCSNKRELWGSLRRAQKRPAGFDTCRAEKNRC